MTHNTCQKYFDHTSVALTASFQSVIPHLQIVCGDENVLVLDTDGGLHFWGSYGDLQKFVSKPTKVALAGERVLDIAATWHSSLNVFSTESGTYFWGMWRGKCKTRPSVGNSTCMETMFAMDKDDFHGSIMCRPVVLIPQGEELLQTGFSEQFNQPVSVFWLSHYVLYLVVT